MSIYVFFKILAQGKGLWVIEFPKPDKSQSDMLPPDPVGADPKGGDKQRIEKENVFCLPTEQRARLGLQLSNPLRRLPYSQPSLCVQVQRESKCERPKQTLKASWVGVKGWRDGQAAGRRKQTY